MKRAAPATLTALTVVLAAAFVCAPRVLAGTRPGFGHLDQQRLADEFEAAFVGYWASGDARYSPGLHDLVDYWCRYHVAKAVIAVLLLVTLAALGARVWRAARMADGAATMRRVGIAGAGILATALALFSLVLVMANLQGAVAPFSSLLSTLPVDEPDGPLADEVSQIQRQLASSSANGSPVLTTMVEDFSRYHLAMAVISAVVAVILGAMAWVVFGRAQSRLSARPRPGQPKPGHRPTGVAPTGRDAKVLARSVGSILLVAALAAVVVAAANTTTAVNPAPALAAFFHGG